MNEVGAGFLIVLICIGIAWVSMPFWYKEKNNNKRSRN